LPRVFGKSKCVHFWCDLSPSDRSEATGWFPVNFQDLAWETGFAESDPKPLAPARVLANLNGQIAVLFNFSADLLSTDRPDYALRTRQ
jgi:hypothetical protein